ncbi:S46 family peptidase [Alloacidobacterium dinghuense]|uniref:Dipeptidyl-peptidase n=1 Tax=Alloacidobacterium dinghuense TaxID=2763107 RepID=A0A7G8BJF1_9BACT|nr:S46 family peptidase [Alloacidobacterium dinghuense]QNI32671.1 S46 family peptidase [Alloacidobacterium dinghuense]
MKNAFLRTSCIALLLGFATTGTRADEGMWTFDNPPVNLIQQRYGFTITKEWLDHVRLSCVRLNDGGSGSFVSADGLLLTNHHVARGQLQKSSTAEHDYVHDGFYAPTYDQEMKSPDLEVNVLQSTEDVTAKVQAAVKPGSSDEDAFKARNAAIAAIEADSLKATGLRSDVVTLYQGGEYWLYRYKKYTDVRIVFAPEDQAAFYGGDPDNFTYPRYDLDMALFRVYENGKPIHTENYLKWSANGPSKDELVFVAGHPGSSERQDTVAQLSFDRDMADPAILALLESRVKTLQQYSTGGAEQTRQAASQIFGLQNAIKVFRGRIDGLNDKKVWDKKVKEETDFRQRVEANPMWQKDYGDAWKEIERAVQQDEALFPVTFHRRSGSQLLATALNLVQYAAEVTKPDGDRLPGFHESQLESLKYELVSPAPVYPGLEIAQMTGGLEEASKSLPANDEWLTAVLNGQEPAVVAKSLVDGTKLADPAVRKALLEGGQSAITASTDPMIVLARKIDPIVRADRKKQDAIDSIEERAGEKLGKARFAVYGKSSYPDATFTLRLSYGAASGYPMNGTIAPYKTTYYGLYDRATSFNNAPPFNLPKRYVERHDKIDLSTPLDFVSTNDIIGGNSGSPVINSKGELVGLIFDGNIESIVGDFIYDDYQNRSVAVHSSAMIMALRQLYDAGKLADEIEGNAH